MEPSTSKLVEALKIIASPVRTVWADSVKAATGDRFKMVFVAVALSVAPRSSVTANVTV